MNNRISSSMMYDQSVFLMLARQSKMNQLERQLATGQKMVSAKDDPVASGTAVGMDRVLAEPVHTAQPATQQAPVVVPVAP